MYNYSELNEENDRQKSRNWRDQLYEWADPLYLTAQYDSPLWHMAEDIMAVYQDDPASLCNIVDALEDFDIPVVQEVIEKIKGHLQDKYGISDQFWLRKYNPLPHELNRPKGGDADRMRKKARGE